MKSGFVRWSHWSCQLLTRSVSQFLHNFRIVAAYGCPVEDYISSPLWCVWIAKSSVLECEPQWRLPIPVLGGWVGRIRNDTKLQVTQTLWSQFWVQLKAFNKYFVIDWRTLWYFNMSEGSHINYSPVKSSWHRKTDMAINVIAMCPRFSKLSFIITNELYILKLYRV